MVRALHRKNRFAPATLLERRTGVERAWVTLVGCSDSPPESCPADFVGSGFVDLEDFDNFMQAFKAGTDNADFTAFVLAFEAGR